jgi:glycosyltransferase involved in cell wall biosynthesis
MAPISVIIPTYNRGVRVRDAIESVLAQRLPAAELIVVDDGSLDDTATVVECMQKDTPLPIIYLLHPNRGPAAARNAGIHRATSPFIAFLDSDDSWRPNKLALQFEAIRAAPAYLISHTNESWIYKGGNRNKKSIHYPRHGDIFAYCLPFCCVGMSTVMVHRDLFERYGLFDETLRCCEDYDMWLRVASHEQFLLVDEPLTIKNGGRPDQVSAQYRIGMDRFRIQALASLLHSGGLDDEHYCMALNELRKKCEIYGNGCIKHDKELEGSYYVSLPKLFDF